MSYEYENVLVTGGAGCIGMAVCAELQRRNIGAVLFDLYEQIKRVESHIHNDVRVFYGSILDSSSLREAAKGCDAVIHLAAYLGVRRTESNSLRCLEINIDGTRNILRTALEDHVIKKIVFASSSEVYGEPLSNPIRETNDTQGKTVYAVSKLAGEELVKAFHSEFPRIQYSILRYFNTYGPHQVAQFVIPKFIKNVAEGMPPIIYGDGLQERSYNYSEDAARATVDALWNPAADGRVMNIGNGSNRINLRDLASKIISISGEEETIEYRTTGTFDDTDRDEGREIFTRYCSTELAKSVIGYEPKVTLDEGLRRVIEFAPIPHEWPTTERSYALDV